MSQTTDGGGHLRPEFLQVVDIIYRPGRGYYLPRAVQSSAWDQGAYHQRFAYTATCCLGIHGRRDGYGRGGDGSRKQGPASTLDPTWRQMEPHDHRSLQRSRFNCRYGSGICTVHC